MIEIEEHVNILHQLLMQFIKDQLKNYEEINKSIGIIFNKIECLEVDVKTIDVLQVAVKKLLLEVSKLNKSYSSVECPDNVIPLNIDIE